MDLLILPKRAVPSSKTLLVRAGGNSGRRDGASGHGRKSGTLAGTDAGFEVDLIDLITVEDGLVKSKDSYIDGVAMQAQLPMVAAQ